MTSNDRSHRFFGSRLALILLATAFVAAPAAADDARAERVAARTLAAMGGQQAWDATRFLRFDFFGFRLHHWDRHTGRHRLEGQTREGDAYVVLHNVVTREGRAFLNGEELAGEARDEWLERAYGAWINDTYWLLMPYKLTDPGVDLAYEGQEVVDGTAYEKLKLTFDGVGLTPGDAYWAWINVETGLMDRWAYHLQDWEAEREPTAWSWLDWGRYGSILLSPRRVKLDDGSERLLDDLAVLDEVPDGLFETP